jgi:POLQ-like helicase
MMECFFWVRSPRYWKLGRRPTRVIRSLQKKIKYGLNSKAAIEFYELGFSDRVLAQDFAGDYGLDFDPGAVPEYVVSAAESIRSKLAGYPSYFLSVLESLI